MILTETSFEPFLTTHKTNQCLILITLGNLYQFQKNKTVLDIANLSLAITDNLS